MALRKWTAIMFVSGLGCSVVGLPSPIGSPRVSSSGSFILAQDSEETIRKKLESLGVLGRHYVAVQRELEHLDFECDLSDNKSHLIAVSDVSDSFWVTKRRKVLFPCDKNGLVTGCDVKIGYIGP